MAILTLQIAKAAIPDNLLVQQLRGSPEEVKRRIAIEDLQKKHMQECRQQLRDVLEAKGIDPRNITELPKMGVILIAGVPEEQEEEIVRVGKERNVILRSFVEEDDDKSVELLNQRAS